MEYFRMCLSRAMIALSVLLALSVPLSAQTGNGSVSGQITDPSGGVIPGVTVTATGAQGAVRGATTSGEGRYTINGLPPDKYILRASAKGFALYEKADVEIKTGRPQTVDIRLTLSVEQQEVTVTESSKVDVNPANNAGAIVLKGADLDAFSDDPDDLASELQALAGPAVGPNGGQIYIDGFTGGRLPPKESIREIRVNSNPFSAEYDRVGFGRIEVFTKPGSDRYRGQAFFSFGDSIFNSRNPFAPRKPSYQSKHFSGNLSGPISKRSSFFVDFDRRNVDETSVVSALILDPSFQVTPFSTVALNPMRRTSLSPRIDFQINPKNTLVGRYTYSNMDHINEGIGEFSLPSRAYNSGRTEHTVQLTETVILSAKTINETRMQFIRHRNEQTGINREPAIRVQEAFTGGGSNVGLSYSHEDRYKIQNYTSFMLKSHFLKVGGRLRAVRQSDRSNQNYNGTFTFNTLNAYRITLQGLQNGRTAQQIREDGGGPSQFSIMGGNPLASVRQFDIGVFLQDDWRLRPNFTLSMGLRYEAQNNISDHRDLAPRIGFAWGLGSSNGNGRMSQPKTVIRGGIGVFYERFSEDLTLQAIRLNGITQQQFVIPSPEFYPNIPSLDTLTSNRVTQSIRRVDPGLKAPYIVQSAIGIERQLPKNISVALTYSRSHGVHTLRSRNINAPLPGTYDPRVPTSGVRPYGDVGNIYAYESGGIFNQNQLITNVNARVNPRLTLFGFYMLNKAKSNTDGAGSFPADQYDLTTEYGRAAFDVRHRTFIGGSITGPFGFRFSPFITASSGRPFNITLGRDLNGDSLFNDRPALATDLNRPSVVRTTFGVLDINPLPGQAIIPRNYGNGPGQVALNLRVSKTMGFGERASSGRGPSSDDNREGGPPAGERGGPRGGGPRGGGPGGMGGRGMGGGGRGMGGIFSEGMADKRYNVTFSVSANNLLNHVNLAPPIGNLSSPLFGRSNAIAGGFGSSATANRRVELQVRFTF